MTLHSHPPLEGHPHLLRRDRASFLEAVTVLAGEPWSDRPAGTDPVVAALAREVNRLIAERARVRLSPLVPLAVDLRSAQPAWNAWLSLHVIGEVLPTAPQSRQRSLAVGALAAARTLSRRTQTGPTPPTDDGAAHPGPVVNARGLTPGAEAALRAVPGATRWAREFLSRSHGSPTPALKPEAPRAAPTPGAAPEVYPVEAACRVMANAASSIVESTARDPDGDLLRLLAGTLVAARAWAGLPEDTADLLDIPW